MDDLTFKIDNFEGPLDLLLELIKSKKLQISEISLIQVADQFINIIKESNYLDLNEISDYLLLASQLARLKSNYILHLQEEKNFLLDQHDETKKLLKKLLEYQKYKELSEQMFQIFNKQLHLEKMSDDFGDFVSENTTISYYLADNNKKEIEEALTRIFENLKERKNYNPNFQINRISIHDRTEEIKKLVAERKNLIFEELFDKKPTVYMYAVTLFCLLELASSGFLWLEAKNPNSLKIRKV